MDTIEIENIAFELRKINAIKMRKLSENDSDETLNDENPNETPIKYSLSVELRQSENKNKIEAFLFYRISSIQNFDILIDAEFFAEIFLKEIFDLDSFPEDDEEKDKYNFLNFTDKFMPNVLKEIDKILNPIFKSMNVKYFPIAKV